MAGITSAETYSGRRWWTTGCSNCPPRFRHTQGTKSMSTLTSQAVRDLPFHRPLLEQEEIDGVVDALKSGWITTGPKVQEFEEAFARFLGVRHALAVSSCTAAL